MKEKGHQLIKALADLLAQRRAVGQVINRAAALDINALAIVPLFQYAIRISLFAGVFFPIFQAAVLSALDGKLPVFGVIKPRSTPFLDAVRSHPKVQVLEVTPETRDDLLQQLLSRSFEETFYAV